MYMGVIHNYCLLCKETYHEDDTHYCEFCDSYLCLDCIEENNAEGDIYEGSLEYNVDIRYIKNCPICKKHNHRRPEWAK
jgi:hypothetical protein